jgi:hypothetical protein
MGANRENRVQPEDWFGLAGPYERALRKAAVK